VKEIVVEKSFKFDNLVDNWTDFVQYIQKKGEYLSEFLALVEKVNSRDTTLILVLKSDFYKQWLSNDINTQQLRNMIFHYVEVPTDFAINIQNSTDAFETDNNEMENNNKMQRRKKIARRLDDLTR